MTERKANSLMIGASLAGLITVVSVRANGESPAPIVISQVQPAGDPVATDTPAEPEKPTPDAGSAVPEIEPGDTVSEVIEDVRSGDWRHAAAGLLTLVMFGWNHARKNFSWVSDRLKSDRAGAISLLVLSAVGGLTSALASSEPLGVWLILSSVWVAVEAAGFFTLVKTLVKPRDKMAEAT